MGQFWAQLRRVLCSGSYSRQSRCSLGCILIKGSTREEFTSKLIHFVGRMHFLMTVGLRRLDFCWLLVGGCPQLLAI